MKKYILTSVLSVAALAATISCDRDHDTETVVQQTNSQDLPVAYDISSAAFVKQNANLYSYSRTFNTPLSTSDVVLIYRQSGSVSGNPVWQLLPKTYYLNQGALDYTSTFTRTGITVYANSDFDISAQDAAFQSNYITGQNLRVVVIPASNGGSTAGKSAAAAVDYSDYAAVIKYYKIDESNIKQL